LAYFQLAIATVLCYYLQELLFDGNLVKIAL